MPVETQSYLVSSSVNCDSQDLSSREGRERGRGFTKASRGERGLT